MSRKAEPAIENSKEMPNKIVTPIDFHRISGNNLSIIEAYSIRPKK